MLEVVGSKVWLVLNFAQQLPKTSNKKQQGVETDATWNIQHNLVGVVGQQCYTRLQGPKARSPLLTASTVKRLKSVIDYLQRGNYKASLTGGCSTIHHGCCYSSWCYDIITIVTTRCEGLFYVLNLGNVRLWSLVAHTGGPCRNQLLKLPKHE